MVGITWALMERKYILKQTPCRICLTSDLAFLITVFDYFKKQLIVENVNISDRCASFLANDTLRIDGLQHKIAIFTRFYQRNKNALFTKKEQSSFLYSV